MKTPGWAIAVIALSTLFIATAQVLMKLAVKDGFALALHNPLLYASVALYIIAGGVMVVTLKYGELSVLYPVISLGFVWVILASIFFLHEPVSWHQLLGTAAIIGGISIIGHRGRKA